MAELAELLRERTPNKSLSRTFHVDPGVFEEDIGRIFHNDWLFAGHTCEVSQPGDYLVLPVGGESILIVRDKEGRLHAHFNMCRHRGSRIVTGARGHSRSFVCPYHQWVYALDGSLRGARLMGEDFDAREYGLISASVRELAGLIFVSLSPEPPSFDLAHEAIAPQLRPHGLERARIIRRDRYEVRANWKTIVENMPVASDLTDVEVCFLVHEDAAEGVDYDPEKVSAVWRATCEQDWELCENNYAGIRSVAYEPGPFSEVTESSVETFERWYLDRLAERETAQSSRARREPSARG